MTRKLCGSAAELRPIDTDDLVRGVRLGIGAAAAMCGVTVRQLSYWTEKGFVPALADEGSRTYDYPAIEKAALIKQGLDRGYTLEGAADEADLFLRRREGAREQLDALDDEEVATFVAAQLDHLGTLVQASRERLVNGHRHGAANGAAGNGEVAALRPLGAAVSQVVDFFERNPFTIMTARQIALKLGRHLGEVEIELRELESRRFLQRIPFPGEDVFRYLPPRK